MLFSKKLLENLFPIFKTIDEKEFDDTLLLMGCEIESKYKFDNIDNLIVGLITEVSKHPKSNKLNLCKVLVNDEIREIICGADNVRENAKVIVALENAKMVDGRVIQYKELLGVTSQGMICAYNELTTRIEFLSDIDQDNIIILDDNAKLNDTNPLKYIHFDDTIYDISIPSNRNELNGLIGIAYDILSIVRPNYELEFNFDFSDIEKNGISVETNDLASFFGTVKMTNVNVVESSWTVKSFLMNCGIKPINSIVDISNLVMILSSNPTHAYDAKSVGDKIELSLLKNSTNLIALDGKEYNVPKNTIIVESKNNPICIAGIIGLNESSINSETKEVIFEVANFKNEYIYNSSYFMNLRTSASSLFSKEISIWITIKSFETMINLLQKSRATFSGISYTPFNFDRKMIPFNYETVKELLGIDISKNEVIQILKNMSFEFNNEFVIPPFYRIDILTINDVVEEILKIIDVNKLESKPLINTNIDLSINNSEHKNIKFTHDYFINKGFSLVKTYNLTSLEYNEQFNLFSANFIYNIINPISKDKAYLRSSIVGQLLNVYEYNSSHKNELIPIFELQKLNYNNVEKYHLSAILDSKHYLNKINKSFLEVDIYFLKSLVLDYMNNFNYEIYFKEINEINSKVMIQKNSLGIYNSDDKLIGFIGQLSPKLEKEMKINSNGIFFLEICVDEILKKNIRNDFFIEKITDNTHKIIRELSIIAENKNVNDLINAIKLNPSILNFNLNDVFNLDEKTTSYNIEFELKKEQEKMSQDLIGKIFNNIIEYFENLGFKIKK